MEKKTAKSWEGHVLAMKGGGQKWFSDGLWDTGTPQRVGWQRLGDVDAIDEIETEKILIVETKIPDEKVTEEVIVEVAEAKDYPPDKEIREFLAGLAEQGKIKKVHHATGQKKLREVYDENTK